MDLFYFAHRIPYPPDKGDKIRAFHQIRELSARHRIHLFCFVDTVEDRRYVDDLRRYCASVDAPERSEWVSRGRAALALLTGHSLSAAAFSSSELRRCVAARLRECRPDAALVFSGAMAPYLALLDGVPAVLDLVDVDSEKWRQYAADSRGPMSWIYRAEADRLCRLEVETAERLGHAVFVSKVEAELFQRHAPGCDCVVIPNGVDLEYFRSEPGDPGGAEPRIVFVGVMDYYPNVDAVLHFCSNVLPLVRREIPEACFDVVGRNPTQKVLQLARLPGVRVTGSVPDVRPYVRASAVAVAPFRIARGIQNKVLEAMALRRPVVGTTQGFQGTTATEQDGVRVVNEPAAMASAIVSFLRDRGLRAAAGERARAYVERSHRWEVHGSRIESLLLEAAARPPAPGPRPG